MEQETTMENNKPKPKNEKPIGGERKEKLTNYVTKKQGLVGEAARAIVKRQQTLNDLLDEMDK